MLASPVTPYVYVEGYGSSSTTLLETKNDRIGRKRTIKKCQLFNNEKVERELTEPLALHWQHFLKMNFVENEPAKLATPSWHIGSGFRG